MRTCGREPPLSFWTPLEEWHPTASSSPRCGRLLLARYRAGCAERQPPCERSGSRSTSGARDSYGPVQSASLEPIFRPRQKSKGHNRPYRPYRPRRRHNLAWPIASRGLIRRRLPKTAVANLFPPTALTHWHLMKRPLRTVWTQSAKLVRERWERE